MIRIKILKKKFKIKQWNQKSAGRLPRVDVRVFFRDFFFIIIIFIFFCHSALLMPRISGIFSAVFFLPVKARRPASCCWWCARERFGSRRPARRRAAKCRLFPPAPRAKNFGPTGGKRMRVSLFFCSFHVVFFFSSAFYFDFRFTFSRLFLAAIS